jgi:hypothetical protein
MERERKNRQKNVYRMEKGRVRSRWVCVCKEREKGDGEREEKESEEGISRNERNIKKKLMEKRRT